MHPFPRFRSSAPARSPHVARRPRRDGAARLPLLGAAIGAAAVVSACSGGDRAAVEARRDARAQAGCATVDTSALVGQAVTQYIASTQPKPLRFLYMSGTDSMLPDGGVRALQDKGPTYLWPADAKQQPIVRKRLDDAGPWNALLVTYRGTVPGGAGSGESVRVRLGGHWIGHEDDGKSLAPKAATFECRSVGDSAHVWRMTGMAEEQSA
jgi:hypothetical protein